MNTLKILVISIIIIIILKLATNLFMRMYRFNDEKLKFTMDVKAESVNKMSALEFEGFCKWLLEGSNNYTTVLQTTAQNDSGVDIILTGKNNEVIYVECKRYSQVDIDNNDSSKKFVIGRETCQKLIGAMVANNIKHGIIMTTGMVHQNALDYVEQLHKNSNLLLEFITMKDIVHMLQSGEESDLYSLIVEV